MALIAVRIAMHSNAIMPDITLSSNGPSAKYQQATTPTGAIADRPSFMGNFFVAIQPMNVQTFHRSIFVAWFSNTYFPLKHVCKINVSPVEFEPLLGLGNALCVQSGVHPHASSSGWAPRSYFASWPKAYQCPQCHIITAEISNRPALSCSDNLHFAQQEN